MDHVMKALAKRPEMTVVELAEQYSTSHPKSQPLNHLYIIRRACKKLRDSGDVELWQDEVTGKLVVRKVPEQLYPWEELDTGLTEHFRKQNEKAAKAREPKVRKYRTRRQ